MDFLTMMARLTIALENLVKIEETRLKLALADRPAPTTGAAPTPVTMPTLATYTAPAGSLGSAP